MAVKKKKKIVNYAQCVPVEIKEFMGEEPYHFITGYNTGSMWMYPYLGNEPKDPSIVFESQRLKEQTIEKAISTLESFKNSKGYISGKLAYGNVNITRRIEVEEKVMEEFKNLIEIYKKESQTFLQLKKLIKTISEDKVAMAKKLKIIKLEQELEKLRKETV